MTLPDISRLSSVPDAIWRAFGERCAEIGLCDNPGQQLFAALQRVNPSLRGPIRKWHLRRTREPWAAAMRMLTFRDPVTPEEAHAVLGDLLEPLIDGGLVERRKTGGVASRLVLHLLDDLCLFGDDLSLAGDAVMGLGPTTVALCGAAFPGPRHAKPTRMIESCLDIGCGSGAAALMLSRCADRAIGTDINPRALALARLNAVINGITNIEFREGSLFDPVRGERFDLIVSQPPFVPMPDGAADSAFLYGGARGDEIALKLLSEVAPHLTERGRALLIVDWPEYGDERLEPRLRAAIGADELDLLLIKAPSTGLDEHATNYAAGTNPALGPGFEEDVIRRREHLERVGIRALSLTFTVLQRAFGRRGATDTLEANAAAFNGMTSQRIDKRMAARALAGQAEALLAARLRLPEGVEFLEQENGPEGKPVVAARFPESALVDPLDMSPDLVRALVFVHEVDDVRAGISRFATAYDASFEEAAEALLPAIEDALLRGVLEIA